MPIKVDTLRFASTAIDIVLFLLFVAFVVMPHIAALPTTGAVTLVGSNNATVFMSGASTTCWFQWGIQTGNNMTWKTPNQTPSGGLCNTTIRGSPIFESQKWYYRACDITGCSSDGTFTTTDVTTIPQPTYGATFENLTDNSFDIMLIGGATMAPFYWVIPTFPGLIWAMLFTGLLIGLWLRGRDLTYVAIIGFILSVGFLGGAYGLGIELDPVFVALGQGIFYAAIAGGILAIIKK
jgi:hypothetical protein